MIAVIDNSSSVRHACFNALTEIGHSVTVFYSPETFIDSGTIYAVDLLVLGGMRVCRTKSEALQWAGSVRPNLRTLLLGYGEIELKHLCELSGIEEIETSRADVCDYRAEIQTVLKISAPTRSEYPTSTRDLKHGGAHAA